MCVCVRAAPAAQYIHSENTFYFYFNVLINAIKQIKFNSTLCVFSYADRVFSAIFFPHNVYFGSFCFEVNVYYTDDYWRHNEKNIAHVLSHGRMVSLSLSLFLSRVHSCCYLVLNYFSKFLPISGERQPIWTFIFMKRNTTFMNRVLHRQNLSFLFIFEFSFFWRNALIADNLHTCKGNGNAVWRGAVDDGNGTLEYSKYRN